MNEIDFTVLLQHVLCIVNNCIDIVYREYLGYLDEFHPRCAVHICLVALANVTSGRLAFHWLADRQSIV